MALPYGLFLWYTSALLFVFEKHFQVWELEVCYDYHIELILINIFIADMKSIGVKVLEQVTD